QPRDDAMEPIRHPADHGHPRRRGPSVWGPGRRRGLFADRGNRAELHHPLAVLPGCRAAGRRPGRAQWPHEPLSPPAGVAMTAPMHTGEAGILRADGLVKRLGGLTATGHASLAVRAGELHALIGPNGAGKTTLIHQLSGVLAPTRGTIHFQGREITHLPIHERARLGLVRSYQITSVFERLPVLDNFALAIQASDGIGPRFWSP